MTLVRHGGGGEHTDTSNIMKVLILLIQLGAACVCVHLHLRPSPPPVVIAVAVIEAVRWRDDAVYLHLGGQEERNWLTMITLWLIRPQASAEYL